MPAEPESEIRIESPTLARFVAALLEGAGVAPAMASEWTKSLIWANLRGVDSHGVLRVPRYVELLKRKTINSAPDIRVERRVGAVAVLEADRAPGAIAMARAMTQAIGLARETHIGWCAARNITHAGAVGYFALQAARVPLLNWRISRLEQDAQRIDSLQRTLTQLQSQYEQVQRMLSVPPKSRSGRAQATEDPVHP